MESIEPIQNLQNSRKLVEIIVSQTSPPTQPHQATYKNTWGVVAEQYCEVSVVTAEDYSRRSAGSAGSALYRLLVDDKTYVNIPKLLEFLKGCIPDKPLFVTSGCPQAGAVLRSVGGLAIADNLVNSSQFRACNYLGQIDPTKCAMCPANHPTSSSDDVICYGNMSSDAMEVYHAHLFPMPPIPKVPAPDNKWTLVTAYFNLAARVSQATNEKPEDCRSFEHYMVHSSHTLGLNQNLIIFCEPEAYPRIHEIRKAYGLLEKTKFYVMQLDDFPYSQYAPQIIENRKKFPSRDPRNTIGYILLMIAKYTMLKMATLENPFKSTHFGWINICISRMGLRNVEYLGRALAEYRDKFSMAYIDYVPQVVVKDLATYYEPGGRCTMCSGFFTGNRFYMYRMCNLIEETFAQHIKAGYGHADEQIYASVYFDHPELIQHYVADYWEMITNYTELYEDPKKTALLCLLPRAAAYDDHKVAHLAARTIWRAYRKGYITLSAREVLQLLDQYIIAVYRDSPETRGAVGIEIIEYLQSRTSDVAFQQAVQELYGAGAGHLLRNTDYFYDTLPPEQRPKFNVAVYLSQVTEDALQKIKSQYAGMKVFIYGDFPLTANSFITSNPVIRTKNVVYQVPYDFTDKVN